MAGGTGLGNGGLPAASSTDLTIRCKSWDRMLRWRSSASFTIACSLRQASSIPRSEAAKHSTDPSVSRRATAAKRLSTAVTRSEEDTVITGDEDRREMKKEAIPVAAGKTSSFTWGRSNSRPRNVRAPTRPITKKK